MIVTEDSPVIPAAMLRAKNPYLSFAKALELFYKPLAYKHGWLTDSLAGVAYSAGEVQADEPNARALNFHTIDVCSELSSRRS